VEARDRRFRAEPSAVRLESLTYAGCPDAIAAGWGLRWLIEEKLGKPVRLVAGGEGDAEALRESAEVYDPGSGTFSPAW